MDHCVYRCQKKEYCLEVELIKNFKRKERAKNTGWERQNRWKIESLLRSQWKIFGWQKSRNWEIWIISANEIWCWVRWNRWWGGSRKCKARIWRVILFIQLWLGTPRNLDTWIGRGWYWFGLGYHRGTKRGYY